MKIKSIQIKNLFEIFNYDIHYPQDGDVLIITGPNGFGKTQILNIVFNLFTKRFSFFRKLVFEEIIFFIENNIRIKIARYVKELEIDLRFSFYEGEQELEIYDYEDRINMESAFYDSVKSSFVESFLREIDGTTSWEEDYEPYQKRRKPVQLKFEEKLLEAAKISFELKSEQVRNIMDSLNVHLIKEQRLLKRIAETSESLSYNNLKQQGALVIETIETYSKDLKKRIQEQYQKSYLISQELDSSYPSRLISEKNKISEVDYNKRFKALKSKQKRLKKNGLYEQEISVLGYSESDAKALLVYLDDLEKKLSVFDELLEQLDLFTSILNERRFTYKSIHIDRKKGFYFKTSKKKILDLNQLSSGEQHEVVLLYELIFNADSNVIVLIDEPEISLHVTWQKEFLNDLLKIVKMRQFQVLVATHSPAIINSRWDLVYNLENKEE